jgi:DNA recombination protein RmuC
MMTTVLLETLPWAITALLLVAALVYLVLRTAFLQRELTRRLEELALSSQEQIAARERLAVREAEMDRQSGEWEKRLAGLAQEKGEERQRYEDLSREYAQLKADLWAQQEKALRLEEVMKERDSDRAQLETLRKEKSALETGYAALQSGMDEERKSVKARMALLEQAETRLSKEFENLANRIFEEKHRKFSEESRKGVEILISPMRDQLAEFRKKVEDVYDRENRDRASLRTEIQSLKSLNERIGLDALNLTKALKGDSKVRGTWGEIQLERLLEDSGLTRGREYEVQAGFRSGEGKRFMPDVVVHLPEKKDVIIDSKVSLVAYEQYFAAETDEDRQLHLKAHIASIRTHVNSLAAKNYDDLIGVNSLDTVIMFVPVEPALLLAFEHESRLFNEAFAKKILLVSPSTLMSTLQIIHNIWRYEYQNMNARTIADEAGKLHDQFVNFVESLEKIGEQIRKAGDIYDQAHKRLVSGRGNLVGRAQKLKILGAKTKKDLGGELIEEAGEGDMENDGLGENDVLKNFSS